MRWRVAAAWVGREREAAHNDARARGKWLFKLAWRASTRAGGRSFSFRGPRRAASSGLLL